MTEEKAEKGFKEKMFDYWGMLEKNLVGFILLKKNELWIKHLLINKNQRGKGLGKKLVEKAFFIAEKNKMKKRQRFYKKIKTPYCFLKS